MKFIDLHCDTASRIFYEKLNLNHKKCKVNIENLKRGENLGQVFAFFIEKESIEDPYDEFIKLYNSFTQEISKNTGEIEIVRNTAELKNAEKSGRIGAFLSIEEGEVIKGDIQKLRTVYDMGIRIITITWNYQNSLGYPNVGYTYRNKGLTRKGVEVIEECEALGIIPDVSHLSDAGFYDLIRICQKPFIASHSNAREITEHPRNLDDNMIKLLAEKGGVMGINFCSDFLGNESVSSIEEMICHIKHIRNIGGIDVLALGSDFDGIHNEVEIENASEFNKLYLALKQNHFKELEIEKIFYKNVLRVFEENFK
ncbi:dipeptidase [Clostridium beijerinckii]|uniref:Membrane dipeptidase n=1 Tax=Clostridium beijerinckii TaxID=1520 RepID=A0AAW3WDZ6_CLOBE|nr:dipeptidase [Clostridium beijerinckii]MBC2459677.1 membrane dipeptidase [Clostridium beijerinckii]MBC2477161.1 membrane dipeptidase [Clostridium beijerinckii]NOV59967.1 membrane dipeptidase [Clostridium beijerinckii]NOV71250.1 membrane dipeptidase [Clostridium beijerinckii]NOW34174.1 membrane dipeptidase [Clostridium beijerinckii]